MSRFLCFLVASLTAWGCGRGAEEENFVRIWPEKPVVEFGSSVVLNCSSNCEKIGLETSLRKVPAGSGTTWQAFNLTSVSQWAVTPLCYARCAHGSVRPSRANFTVYQAPEQVILDPVPKMEVGKEYNLTCRVPSVAPIQNLTVTFFKGGKPLLVKTFESYSAPEPSDVVVTHPITVQKKDQGEEITCEATLDLRPDGPFLEKTSARESLAPAVFPLEPHLRTPQFVENNTEAEVTCGVSGVFPAEEAKFELLYGGEDVNSKIVVQGDSANAAALVSFSSEARNLTCTVSLGPITRTVEAVVNVYSLPKPVLLLTPSEVLANSTVMVTCSPGGSESPGVFMWIEDARGTLISRVPGSTFVQHEVTTHEGDDGREFRCKVELIVNGHPVVKNTSKKLYVFYGPQMNESSCPDQLTWKEGNVETFTCSAYGNPPPTVECNKDNTTYVIGTPQQITREYDGVYHCRATNAHGFADKVVTVVVEFYQPDILAIVLSVLAVAAIVTLAIVVYLKYYEKNKCGKYILRPHPRQAAENNMEQKCLNGNSSV